MHERRVISLSKKLPTTQGFITITNTMARAMATRKE
jgi:hypothetical protein